MKTFTCIVAFGLSEMTRPLSSRGGDKFSKGYSFSVLLRYKLFSPSVGGGGVVPGIRFSVPAKGS